jgi:DNA-binding MarR family transcriptional regulator
VNDSAEISGEDTATAITDAVLTASRLLVSLSARSIAGVDESITIPQFRVLVVLDTLGPLNLAALAHHLGVRPSTMTRMVDRLVQAGLSSREPSPTTRREFSIELTPHGRAIVGEVTDRRRREIGAVVQRMPPHHRSGLVRALSVFTEAGGDPGSLASSEAFWA